MGNGPDAHLSVNPKGTRERVGDLTSENTLSLWHLIIHFNPLQCFIVQSVCFKMYESEYTTRNTCSESQIDVWFCKGNYHRELKLEFVKWLLKRGGCLWLLKEVLLY